MSWLPDAASLARLVTDVTLPMCGTSFVPVDQSVRGQSICGRMMLLRISGPRDVSVVLSTDKSGGQGLAAALLGCPPQSVDNAMVNDSIAEVLNMVAGQLSRLLGLNQELGLPRPFTLAELGTDEGVGFDDAVLLESEGDIQLKLWIFERSSGQQASARGDSPSLVRSLIRRLRSFA